MYAVWKSSRVVNQEPFIVLFCGTCCEKELTLDSEMMRHVWQEQDPDQILNQFIAVDGRILFKNYDRRISWWDVRSGYVYQVNSSKFKWKWNGAHFNSYSSPTIRLASFTWAYKGPIFSSVSGRVRRKFPRSELKMGTFSAPCQRGLLGRLHELTKRPFSAPISGPHEAL